jgi:hypothetical protein
MFEQYQSLLDEYMAVAADVYEHASAIGSGLMMLGAINFFIARGLSVADARLLAKHWMRNGGYSKIWDVVQARKQSRAAHLEIDR